MGLRPTEQFYACDMENHDQNGDDGERIRLGDAPVLAGAGDAGDIDTAFGGDALHRRRRLPRRAVAGRLSQTALHALKDYLLNCIAHL